MIFGIKGFSGLLKTAGLFQEAGKSGARHCEEICLPLERFELKRA